MYLNFISFVCIFFVSLQLVFLLGKISPLVPENMIFDTYKGFSEKNGPN